jgi:MFS family permease
MGIGPVLWATLSDGYKIRRILYLVSTAIFCAASIGGGYATSAGGLTAARVFQAIGSSGPAMLGPGSVADIYVSLLVFGVGWSSWLVSFDLLKQNKTNRFLQSKEQQWASCF